MATSTHSLNKILKRRPDGFGDQAVVAKRGKLCDSSQSAVSSATHGPSSLNNLGPHKASSNTVNQKLQRITESILRYVDTNKQSESLLQRKFELHGALYNAVKQRYSSSGLYIVGSSITGFGGSSSDMDLCLMIGHGECEREQACATLRTVMQLFRRLGFLRNIMLIRARVPILKFVDSVSGVECDLNINNSVGIRNTHLLSAYNQLDRRLGALVLFVKRWAKAQNINDASMATLSSYSLVLMVIHYLQFVCSPPVVPSLQRMYPTKFSMEADIQSLRLDDKLPPYQSTNTQPVGELFMGFLRYYGHDFNYDETAISVRLGTTLPRSSIDERADFSRNGLRKPLWIEEPFDRSNTARSVYDLLKFQQILRVFRRSLQELERTGDVKVILNNPM